MLSRVDSIEEGEGMLAGRLNWEMEVGFEIFCLLSSDGKSELEWNRAGNAFLKSGFVDGLSNIRLGFEIELARDATTEHEKDRAFI